MLPHNLESGTPNSHDGWPSLELLPLFLEESEVQVNTTEGPDIPRNCYRRSAVADNLLCLQTGGSRNITPCELVVFLPHISAFPGAKGIKMRLRLQT